MKIIFTTTKNYNGPLKECLGVICYPENTLTTQEQINYMPPESYHGTTIITNSVFIVGNFDKSQVQVLDVENDQFYTPDFQTFGASYQELLKQLLDVQVDISPIAVEGIREKQKENDQAALEYVKSLGKSSTRAYMTRVLENNLK